MNALVLLAAAAIAPTPVPAASLEFRSEGFFASPDARVKLFREPWRYCPHLDVDGQLAVNIEGPILRPGYNTLSGDATKTQIDPAQRLMIDTGTIGKFAASCRRTISEYEGGMLIRLEYGQTPEVNEANCRLIFPIDVFKNRRVRWQQGEIVLPNEKPDNQRATFLNDPKGNAKELRFDLGQGRELGVKFLSPTKGLLLADCRQWNEMNYHLQATFAGQTMLLYVCLLKPEEPFPAVEPPPNPAKAPQAQMSDAGAVFSARDGLYDILVAKSGQVLIQKKGSAILSIEPPSVRQKDALYPLDEQVSFETKDNHVEVDSKSKDKPFHLHQSFAIEDDGWLSVSAKFEGPEAGDRGQVELSLPAKLFAGRTVRAAERFFNLPKNPSPEARLFDDWKGGVRDYDLPLDAPERLTLVCDQKATTYLSDGRKWNQPSFKIGMTSQDGVVKYRLHFWKDDGAPPVCAKGNLLRDGASFETGPDGVRPYACFSWYDKMVEPGVPPVFDATTAVHGTTSLCLTAGDSQKLGNPHGFAFVGAAFNRVALQRDRKYTVSAYLKADRPGVKAVIYCGESTWAGEDWGPFPVTTEWKRYDFPFFTADFRKTGYYLTWVGLDPGCKQGKLWIDAVQLEEGDLSDFQPSAEVEYGVEVPNREKLFGRGDSCGAVLHVRNNGKKPLSCNVSFVIKDYWEQSVRTGSVAVSVPPENTAAYSVDLGQLPCGYYRGYFTAPAGEVKELIFGVYKPQPLVPLPDDWPLACHNDPMPLVRKLGFGSVRAFEIFEFSDIARQKGKFDFSRSDRMVKRAEECGLSILPILSEFAWPGYRQDPPIPPWAQEKVGENVLESGQRVRLAWPTIEAWKDYVRALTSRYKGRINYWEVMNEPNLIMTAEQYAPYLQAAYEAAKLGNPDCRVVGVCGTSDFAGKPGSFTDSVLKLGGSKHLDVLSEHLYDTHMPEQTLGTGSDQLIEHWRKTMKETYGREVPVWHTERSFSCREMAYSARKVNVPAEYCEEPQFLIDTVKHKAEYMIRETLLDSVAGGGPFFWFGQFDYENCFITVRYFEPYGLDHAEFDQSPCPELIAANGLARVLDGVSHPYRQLSLGDGVCCCVFAGEKGSVAALWNWKTKGPIGINVGQGKYVLHNFFGEPITVAPDGRGQIEVDLEGAPKYLSLLGQDGEACCRVLKQ